MKFLEIKNQDALSEIFDAALKFGGMAMQSSISKAINSIKNSTKEDGSLVELDPDTDRNFHIICDAALKFSGMKVHGIIQGLTESISEKPDSSV